MIHKFLTNRINLTIFQCILYFIIGYVMGEYLTWEQLVLMFVIMLVIQMITRVKAIADGILIVQMLDNKFETQRGDLDKLDKDIDRLMKDSKKMDKKDLN
tara:strand:+ start:266 stop:565 length:300 start_codon:yes stop_codon:yes gene_type:complete